MAAAIVDTGVGGATQCAGEAGVMEEQETGTLDNAECSRVSQQLDALYLGPTCRARLQSLYLQLAAANPSARPLHRCSTTGVEAL